MGDTIRRVYSSLKFGSDSIFVDSARVACVIRHILQALSFFIAV